ncbi:MAG: hypothetical protein ACE5GW_13910, partial [Planctomycetota bacterium]
NMPGAVARTSTFALTNATFPYLRKLAASGLGGLTGSSPGEARGLNIHRGRIFHEGVSEAFGLNLAPREELPVAERGIC